MPRLRADGETWPFCRRARAPGPGLKYKAALSIAYGASLRAGEVVKGRAAPPP
jgi:hypothetical protein